MTRKLPLPERVAETIRRLKMIGPGDRVLVAVSGGADSVCLLTILTNLGFEVGVAHFNHGLRGEASDGDETFVKTLASRLGLGFFMGGEKSTLRAGNLEEQARLARRAFLDQIAEREDFTKVALAHSRNDRNETVLLNLLRGSGSEGLVSMRPVARNTIRPPYRNDKTRHRNLPPRDRSGMAVRRNEQRPRLCPQPDPTRCTAQAGIGIQSEAAGHTSKNS